MKWKRKWNRFSAELAAFIDFSFSSNPFMIITIECNRIGDKEMNDRLAFINDV